MAVLFMNISWFFVSWFSWLIQKLPVVTYSYVLILYIIYIYIIIIQNLCFNDFRVGKQAQRHPGGTKATPTAKGCRINGLKPAWNLQIPKTIGFNTKMYGETLWMI